MKHEGPILLVGFEVFAKHAANPSGDAVKQLHGKRIGGRRVVGACLPVSFKRAPQELRKLLRKYDPVLVLCVGLAASRSHISLERLAVNLADARIPDNDGDQPIDMKLRNQAPMAYLSNLPLKTMVTRLQGRGITAELSLTAGTYVCNAVFYSLMHALRRRPGVRGGFIHVPPVKGAARTATQKSMKEIVSALRICIGVGLKSGRDMSIGMGRED